MSTESIRQHCTTGWYPLEAWCLQYNQHVGKTLLHPVIEPHIAKIVQTSRLRNVSQENDTNECPTATDNLPNQNSQTPDKELLDFAMGKVNIGCLFKLEFLYFVNYLTVYTAESCVQ